MAQRKPRGTSPPNAPVLFADLYWSGVPVPEIARRYSLHPEIVRKAMRRNPEWVACGRRGWSPARRQRAVSLYSDGLSVDAIATAMRSSRTRVREVLRAAGITIRPAQTFPAGDANPSWKGGVHIIKGYRMIRQPDHPNATAGGYVAEHRLVMEQAIGRILAPVEVVHHVNGDRLDNRIENLQLFGSNGEHLAVELQGRVPKWSEDGKRRILAAVRKKRTRRSRSKSDAQL